MKNYEKVKNNYLILIFARISNNLKFFDLNIEFLKISHTEMHPKCMTMHPNAQKILKHKENARTQTKNKNALITFFNDDINENIYYLKTEHNVKIRKGRLDIMHFFTQSILANIYI